METSAFLHDFYKSSRSGGAGVCSELTYSTAEAIWQKRRRVLKMSERLLQQGKEIICFSQNTGDITFFS